jgi:hypothetical protein
MEAKPVGVAEYSALPRFPEDYSFWDSWYLHASGEYHALMLCAEKRHYDLGEHHKHSRLAYARSRDLTNWQYVGKEPITLATDRTSSVWTGSAIRWRGRYILSYTLRRTWGDYFAGQTVRFATSDDFVKWEACGGEITLDSIDPDGAHFLRLPEFMDRTVHAWRDPYLFVHNGKLFMTVAAKLNHLKPGRRACVALLQAEGDWPADSRWRLVLPSLVSGYEELEVPQVYVDQSGCGWLVASTWDDTDYELSWLRGSRPMDPSSPNPYRRHGYLLGFRASSIEELLAGRFEDDTGTVLVGPDSMFYAGRIVPEQPGTALGFDPRTGLPKLLRRELPARFSYISPESYGFGST